MKNFKKFILLMTFIMITLFPLGAFAEEGLSTVKVYFTAEKIPTITENEVVFELYDEGGETLFDTKVHTLKRGHGGFEIEFSVPEYSAGTKFKFVVASGAKGAIHGEKNAAEHILETYAMPGGEGVLENYTSFYMSLDPYWNREAYIKIPSSEKTLFYHCVEDSDIYITYDLLDELGIRHEKVGGEKPCVKLYTDEEHEARFYINDIYALIGGEGVNLEKETFEIDAMPFVPLSKVAQYFACGYEVVKNGEYTVEINLGVSEFCEAGQKEKFVNSKNITSKTDYIIWVSKKDFEVNLFVKNGDKWAYVNAFPCSIGKPSTPTIEGAFEYYQYQPIWNYDKYYCGPVMRFYGGYALHSYLIKYNGKPYDARLGKKVSEGCVRMHPDDITWLAENIPLYTRVWVTGE